MRDRRRLLGRGRLCGRGGLGALDKSYFGRVLGVAGAYVAPGAAAQAVFVFFSGRHYFGVYAVYGSAAGGAAQSG